MNRLIEVLFIVGNAFQMNPRLFYHIMINERF